MTRTALVLAGHGSHVTPETAGLIWSHVDALRARHAADEITAAFWKEPPAFHAVLGQLDAADVTVVPLFTAHGYFTQTVIPAEMGIYGPATWRGGKLIRCTRTLAEHPYLADVVCRRIQEAMRELGAAPERTAIAIIGHSTRRNSDSRRATEKQVELIRASGMAAQVEAVYLDDTPAIADIYTLTTAPDLIAVPYFLALGSHTTIDVPRELGVKAPGRPYKVRGRRVYYTPPVGIDETLREVIVQLAREAGAPLPAETDGSPWDAFPSAGRDVLAGAVSDGGTMRFGDLRLTMTDVRHWDEEGDGETLHTPSALRERVRENPFRSLPTSDDLPRGWRVPIDSPAKLHAAVETIYPGAVADWAAERRGTFRPSTFDRTIARQTGNFCRLAGWSAARQGRIVDRVCTHCVRRPDWFAGRADADRLPCAEPCNHWLSAALASLDESSAS